jgi:hypothetical protein
LDEAVHGHAPVLAGGARTVQFDLDVLQQTAAPVTRNVSCFALTGHKQDGFSWR